MRATFRDTAHERLQLLQRVQSARSCIPLAWFCVFLLFFFFALFTHEDAHMYHSLTHCNSNHNRRETKSEKCFLFSAGLACTSSGRGPFVLRGGGLPTVCESWQQSIVNGSVHVGCVGSRSIKAAEWEFKLTAYHFHTYDPAVRNRKTPSSVIPPSPHPTSPTIAIACRDPLHKAGATARKWDFARNFLF